MRESSGSRCYAALFAAILAFPILQASAQTAPAESPVGTPYTLRVNRHEVVVEVVARDRSSNPVRDLGENEIQVYEIGNRAELGKRSQRSLMKAAAFRLVDPVVEKGQADVSSGGFRITLGGGCAVATTFHYELAFQPSPDNWKSGYHEILVTTNRPHVTLAYHHQYYVGEMDVPAKPRVHDDSFANDALHQAACYHADTPASIALKARLVQTADTDPLRYSLVIQPDSLGFASISNATQPDQMRQVKLDYAACTFDVQGKALKYMHTSTERALSSEEYARVRVAGFSNVVNLPRQGEPALVRFVVRDRQTGNIGVTDVPATVAELIGMTKSTKTQSGNVALGGGTFGSILPQTNAFCGDVYELPKGTRMLPTDYGNLNAVGAIYTGALNVPYGFLADGISGVTSRPEYFGIDYHGQFWVKDPGEYRFQMTADDGAELFYRRSSALQRGWRPFSDEKRALYPTDCRKAHDSCPLFSGDGACRVDSRSEAARRGSFQGV